MIAVTRLNGTLVVVNAELIEFVEATPDTLVTLTTGRKVNLRETVDEVVERVLAYRRSCHPQTRPVGLPSWAPRAAEQGA